jgi:hypothetical protein
MAMRELQEISSRLRDLTLSRDTNYIESPTTVSLPATVFDRLCTELQAEAPTIQGLGMWGQPTSVV